MNYALHIRLLFIGLVAIALLSGATICKASNSRPPRNNDITNMADALKYLHDLDNFYGDAARVRFGKRNPLSQLIRNHMSDISDINARLNEFPAADEPF